MQKGFVIIKVEIRINVILNLNQISGVAVYVDGIVYELFWNAQNTLQALKLQRIKILDGVVLVILVVGYKLKASHSVYPHNIT